MCINLGRIEGGRAREGEGETKEWREGEGETKEWREGGREKRRDGGKLTLLSFRSGASS